MQVVETALADLLICEPRVYEDERGFFYESFNQRFFDELTQGRYDFVQDNHSKSVRGVLRGLHYQLPPHEQGKLVRVVRGEVLDVAVDLRPDSPTRGHHVSVVLSEQNRRQVWVPPGFAHGFLVRSETAEFLYKTTAFYEPASERCIVWNDPILNIDWQLGDMLPIVSAKDQIGSPYLQALADL